MIKRTTDSALAILLRTVFYPITMLLSRTKVKQRIILENEYIPVANKPIIFACNHSAFPDTPVALRAVRRHCYTLIGKQNLAFVDKLFFFLAGAVWVDRKSKESSAYSKERIVAYLNKGKSILWFPEATWNLTDGLLMLPMRWGIIEIAQQSGAQIIPMALDYDRDQELCRVRFGVSLDAESLVSKKQGIAILRDAMATLRWDFISRNQASRADLHLEKERDATLQVVRDYPPLDWNYEESCIYHIPGIVNHEEVFTHLDTIRPTMQNAFLFNKRLKGDLQMSSDKKLTESEKMVSGKLFNPADKSFFFTLARAEWLQRKLNKAPLWAQGRKERIFKKLVGSCDGNPYNIFTPFKVVCGKNIHVGKNFFSNWNVCLQDYAEIHIGDNVFIGPNVSIVTIQHPINAEERKPRKVSGSLTSGSRGNFEKALPVHIGNNVLIYTNSTICPGVTISDNSIIGAGSVVTKDIPTNVFACGVPCKVIREITEEDRIINSK